METGERIMGRPVKWPEATLIKLEARYPHERTDVLAEELGIPLASLKWYASKKGWRKTRKFKSDLGRECAQAPERNRRVLEEMAGAEQRIIHSGTLLVRGNTTVHLAK